jgi:GntR family transcriptional regulator, transcriptional repressor for pyruvate dehydrogenase complex
MRVAGKRTLVDQVTEDLRRRILSGAYAPGDKLVPELTLATEFRVNRFTIREAMNKLEQLHLIQRRPGSGTVVLDYSRHASVDILEDIITDADGRLNPFVLSHLLESARILSGEVAALAALRRTDSDLAALRGVVKRMHAESRLSRLLWLDFEFHWELAVAASNIVPRLVLNSVRAMLQRYAPLLETLLVTPGLATEGYEHVLDALRRQEPERARAIVQWIWASRHTRFVDLVNAHAGTTPSPPV